MEKESVKKYGATQGDFAKVVAMAEFMAMSNPSTQIYQLKPYLEGISPMI
ncbi:MAG: hypothetical protein AAF620_18065 [Bacteroidota bacterium]